MATNIVDVDVPNDIANLSAQPWGTTKVQLGANFDVCDANAAVLNAWLQRLTLEMVGPAVLLGSPAPFVTGVGTTTFTLASGTIASVPQGADGAYTGAVIVETPELTQGATLSATNYVWLRLSGDTLEVIVTTSATVPDNCVLLASAAVTTAIDSITLEALRDRAWD